MKTSKAGLDLIKRFEGFRAGVYLCPAGVATIGYGHAIKPGEKFTTITEHHAESLLIDDVEEAEEYVNELVEVGINQDQFDALVSFTFNLGGGALKRSTLLKKINALKFEEAKAEFSRWVYAGGERLPGLVKRRKAEAEIFLPRPLYVRDEADLTERTEA